jgi:hypothetical protein
MVMKAASIPRLLLAILGMLATPAGLPATESPRATYTAEQLRAGLLATADKIKSLSVVYRSNDYDPKLFPMGTYLYREIIAQSPGSLHHVSAHGHATLDWKDDPYQQSAYVSGDHAFNEFPVNRKYIETHIGPNDALPGTLPSDFFFLSTGIWPFDGRPAPRPLDRPYMLREVARAKEFSTVRPRQELVDGRWCHVLESPGNDRLWLDTERGCALLARETIVGKWLAVGQRFELGGHREVGPGIWLPRWIHNMQFDYEAPTEEGRRRKLTDARHEVLRAEVSRVDDSAFNFRPRPGSLLENATGAPTQAEPGGLDHLDHLVHWLREHAPASSPRTRSAIPIGSVALLPVILYVAASEVLRRRAARPPGATEGRP